MNAPRFELSISRDTQLAIEKFTAHAIEAEKLGTLSFVEHRQAQCYAVEALCGILQENPRSFRYWPDISAVIAKRKGGAS